MPETPETSTPGTSAVPTNDQGQTPKTKEEIEEKNQEVSDCITLAISVITRASYLIQLDEVRAMFILDDMVRTKMDGLIINEIEETLGDITALLPCEFFDYLDADKLSELVDELGGMDVNKAKPYGEQAWDIFSDSIIKYALSTWSIRPGKPILQ